MERWIEVRKTMQKATENDYAKQKDKMYTFKIKTSIDQTKV